jgi:hypothetical protein
MHAATHGASIAGLGRRPKRLDTAKRLCKRGRTNEEHDAR